MTKNDIVRMAREAKCMPFRSPEYSDDVHVFATPDVLERFANLVAAAERERIKWDGIHSCHSECDKPVCVAIRKAVEAEREACAKVCMDKWMEWMDALPDKRLDMRNDAEDCAFAIRERGAP
jgi:hypothetical protein